MTRETLTEAQAEINRLTAQIEAIRALLPESLRGKDVTHGVKLLAMGYASHDRQFWRYGYALRIAMQLVDRAAGEEQTWEADGDKPELSSVAVCERIAKLLEIEIDGPLWTEMLKPVPAGTEDRLAEASPAGRQALADREGQDGK